MNKNPLGITKRHVRIAVVGSPNVGKSSIMNKWIGYKNSIVSPKPHTTRCPVLGVMNYSNVQFIFIDTPGYIKDNSKVSWSSSLIKSLQKSLEDCDFILLIVDATRPEARGTNELLETLCRKENMLIAINKIDLEKKNHLYPIVKKIVEYGYNNIVYLISSKSGEGLDDLQNAIVEYTNSNLIHNENWIFESEEEARLAMPKYISECVREKVFHYLNQELPFNTWVRTTKFSHGIKWRSEVVIYVARKAHKNIIIGKNGQMLKKIGIAARVELMSKLGHGHLFLKVELDENSIKTDKEIHSICMLEK